MKVVITDAAKADLVEISEFIRPHNPKRAITFTDELLDRCATLVDMPNASIRWFRVMSATVSGIVYIGIT